VVVGKAGIVVNYGGGMPAISAPAVIAEISPPTRTASNEVVGGTTPIARPVRTWSSGAIWMQAGDQTADSYSDRNTGESRRSAASGCARGARVKDACERL
jgi:hypothetical protein